MRTPRPDIRSILARLAACDHAAVLTLVDAHGDRLAGVVSEVRRAHHLGPLLPAAMDAAVLAAGFAVAEAAREAVPTGSGGAHPVPEPDPWAWVAARLGEACAPPVAGPRPRSRVGG